MGVSGSRNFLRGCLSCRLSLNSARQHVSDSYTFRGAKEGDVTPGLGHVAGMSVLIAALATLLLPPQSAFEAEQAELYHYAFAIGVCEPALERRTVTSFLGEFVGVEPDWANEQLMASSNAAARGYVEGRKRTDTLQPDTAQCVRSIEAAERQFVAKVRERLPDYER